MNTDWLAHLKEGDRVAYYAGVADIPMFAQVERATPTQVVVNGSRFCRTTGRVISSDRWDRTRLAPVTPQVEAAVRRAWTLSVLRGMPWDRLTDAQLFAVLDIVKAGNAEAHSHEQAGRPERD